MARRNGNAAVADDIGENDAAFEPVSITETLTYCPGQGDNVTTKWGGHTFHANVPKEITGNPAGTDQERINHQMIMSARNNHPCFAVGDGGKVKKARNAPPKTADEYRAWFVRWMQDPQIVSAEGLIARFAKDRELQAACEVGADDFAQIRDLFMPKLSDLQRADELSNEQVAQMWLNHGINQLPW